MQSTNLKENSATTSDPATIELEQDEFHFVVNSHHIRLGSSPKAMVSCEDISFEAESTPVICVVDQQVLNYLFEQEQYVNLPKPWKMFTYVTKPMLDRSPCLDYKVFIFDQTLMIQGFISSIRKQMFFVSFVLINSFYVFYKGAKSEGILSSRTQGHTDFDILKKIWS